MGIGGHLPSLMLASLHTYPSDESVIENVGHPQAHLTVIEYINATFLNNH